MMVAVLAAAVVLAVIANVMVWLIVTGPLGEPLLMCSDCSATPPELSPMDMGEPILFSTLFGVGAVVVYAVIRVMAARPLRVFAIVATAVLLVSIALPSMVPPPPVEMSTKLTLIAMHLVGYSVILATVWIGEDRGWLLPSTSRPARSSSGREGPASDLTTR
jgi:hypothetical protein